MKYNSLMMLSIKEGFDPNKSIVVNNYLLAYDKHTKFWVVTKLRQYKRFYELDHSYDMKLFLSKEEAAESFTALTAKPFKKGIR